MAMRAQFLRRAACQYVAMFVDGTMSHRVSGSRLSTHHLLVVTRQLCKTKGRVLTGSAGGPGGARGSTGVRR